MLLKKNMGPLSLFVSDNGKPYKWLVAGCSSGTEPTPEAAHRAALQAAVRLLRGWLGEAERELGEHQPLPPPAGGQ